MTGTGTERHFETPGGIVRVFSEPYLACRAAADEIAAAMGAKAGRAVLGLATGGSPIQVYQRLVERHHDKRLSFRDAVTFNLDEYYPISPLDPNSYRSYMHHHLFAHVDLPANRAHVLDGTVPETAVADHAARFDRWIAEAGGLDLQLLGVGRNGHIGFNEPCDMPVEQALALPTRLVALHPTTTADAAQDFGGQADRVPRHAITMGIAPILAARSIVVLAFGSNKAEAVRGALRGPITALCPASLLQSVRGKVHWLVDEAAAAMVAD